ncbi:MAG: metallophosphoesterase family protein [Flavobacteriales bacterium]|nr:metallophosphoesterase family protein [Flavobacteriales bacterium]
MHIGLLSDTHGYIDDRIMAHLEDVDEIWHAGDMGSLELMDKLEAARPVRGVYGNIDGGVLRRIYPLHQRFMVEGVDVWMTHIGGRPGRYNRNLEATLMRNPPRLFICGHSHILRVEKDPKQGFLYMNPGAAGRHGFHKIRTLLKFRIDSGKIHDLRVVELGPRVQSAN